MQEGIYIKVVEQWKDVPGWEDRYMVSNTGKVWSKCTNKIRKTDFTPDGYEVIMLARDGKQYGTFVHRLVAKAFLPNPNNLPIVNHKDENPRNNHVDNLEWCTYSYNNTYNNVHLRTAQKIGRKVYQYNSNGDLIGEYYSGKEAARILGIKSDSNISDCCNGRLYTIYGYVLSYDELSKEEVLERFEKSNNSIPVKNNPKMSKPLAQYDSNMNLIATFPSAREAHRQLGYALSSIASTCRGEHKTCHGFIFKYIE